MPTLKNKINDKQNQRQTKHNTKTLLFAGIFLFLFLVVEAGNIVFLARGVTSQNESKIETPEIVVFIISMVLLVVFNFFFIKCIKEKYKQKTKSKSKKTLLGLAWVFLLIRIFGFLFFFASIIVASTGTETDTRDTIVFALLAISAYTVVFSIFIDVFWVVTVSIFAYKKNKLKNC